MRRVYSSLKVNTIGSFKRLLRFIRGANIEHPKLYRGVQRTEEKVDGAVLDGEDVFYGCAVGAVAETRNS